MQHVVGEDRRRSRLGGLGLPLLRQGGGAPPAEGQAGDPGEGDDDGKRHAEHGQGEEGGHREQDQARLFSAFVPTRMTARTTMARTAAARPANTALITVVVP